MNSHASRTRIPEWDHVFHVIGVRYHGRRRHFFRAYLVLEACVRPSVWNLGQWRGTSEKWPQRDDWISDGAPWNGSDHQSRMKSNGIKEKIHLFYASEKYYENWQQKMNLGGRRHLNSDSSYMSQTNFNLHTL
jgi:hypothetical protein